MDRRIVFLDIDGTLITDRQELPDSAREAVGEARARGHVVFLASGRSKPEVYPWLWEVGFDGLIGSGGSFAQVGDGVLFEHLIPQDQIAELRRYFIERRIDYVFQSSQGIYPSPGFIGHFQKLSEYLAAHPVPGGNPPDWSALLEVFLRFRDDPSAVAGKSTFVCPMDGSIRLAEVQRDWAGTFDIIPGSLNVLGVDNGELMIHGVNKGTAAREVARHLGIPFEASVAFGDSENDVEMVRDCAVGVAMGNAREAVKAVADHVTERIDEDGLANAFRRIGLIG